MSLPQTYDTPYYKNLVLITDFNCGVANTQIALRFQNVFLYITGMLAQGRLGELSGSLTPAHWAQTRIHRARPILSDINNVPFGNIDFAAYASYCCYRALGQNTRPNVFVHVTDPGVGFGKDRSILYTDEDNVFIGPNNGSLGLIGKYFAARGIPYEIRPINIPLIETLERERMQSPTYIMPSTFHGRDLFAVVAGLVAGGIDPRKLVTDDKAFHLKEGIYAQNIDRLSLEKGVKKPFYVYRDNTFGNLKTSLSVDAITFDQLVAEKALFRVTPQRKSLFLPSFLQRGLVFPAKNVFADSKVGQPLLYIGSTFAINWDERFIELAVNMGDAAARLGVHDYRPEAFNLTRIA